MLRTSVAGDSLSGGQQQQNVCATPSRCRVDEKHRSRPFLQGGQGEQPARMAHASRLRVEPPPLGVAPHSAHQPRAMCHSQRQGYVSRAAFKLLEIQKKHKVVKQGETDSCITATAAQVACPMHQVGARCCGCCRRQSAGPGLRAGRMAAGCLPTAWPPRQVRDMAPRRLHARRSSARPLALSDRRMPHHHLVWGAGLWWHPMAPRLLPSGLSGTQHRHTCTGGDLCLALTYRRCRSPHVTVTIAYQCCEQTPGSSHPTCYDGTAMRYAMHSCGTCSSSRDSKHRSRRCCAVTVSYNSISRVAGCIILKF